MEQEDDKNVLQHLLYLETEASTLVVVAQGEADRRVSEGEKACRAAYNEAYAAEVANLEAAHVKEIAAIREDFNKQLETYRNSLASGPMDQAAFSILMRRLLLGEA